MRYKKQTTDRRMTVARFDQWAPEYNDSALQPLLYQAVHTVVLDRCARAIASPRRLLDVGCGTGRLLRSAGSRFPATGLVGVDVSGAMLSVAAVTMASASSPLLLVRAGAERLPFADAAFDLVTATLTYRHWADQSAGVAEVGRVLTPGGVFGLAALLTPARGARRRWLRRAGRARVPPPLLAALADAGLRPDRVEEVCRHREHPPGKPHSVTVASMRTAQRPGSTSSANTPPVGTNVAACCARLLQAVERAAGRHRAAGEAGHARQKADTTRSPVSVA